MAFGSLDLEKVCLAEPSTQLLELISKMNFDSVDPTLLVSLLIRRDFSFAYLLNVLNFFSFWKNRKTELQNFWQLPQKNT